MKSEWCQDRGSGGSDSPTVFYVDFSSLWANYSPQHAMRLGAAMWLIFFSQWKVKWGVLLWGLPPSMDHHVISLPPPSRRLAGAETTPEGLLEARSWRWQWWRWLTSYPLPPNQCVEERHLQPLWIAGMAGRSLKCNGFFSLKFLTKLQNPGRQLCLAYWEGL